MNINFNKQLTIITAGSTYLDIDAYACCVAMAELLKLQGKNAVAYSKAPYNYSVCKSLIENDLIISELPLEATQNAEYIIVDVSDPDFLEDSVPLEKVVEIYDHHTGFEEYWTSKIGDNAHIEFIGAAATLIYRKWQSAELLGKMSRTTALLLVAAILDNTLNLTSSNTTTEDIEVFNELCKKENLDSLWCATYFSEVLQSIEADLRNALLGDIKNMSDDSVLPSKIAQLCVWNPESIILRLPDIRTIFDEDSKSWMINLIDVKHNCSFFVCDDKCYQKKLENIFKISFNNGVAKTNHAYLRKQIIKKAIFDK